MNKTTCNAYSKGSVLLICLGVLALLSLLGSAVLLLSRQEERSSMEYLNEMRAEFAADSGVESAVAQLLTYSGSLVDLPARIETVPFNPILPLTQIRQSSFGSLDTNGDGLNDAAGYVSETFVPKGDIYRLRVESAQSKININDSNSPMNIDSDPFEDQMTPERDYDSIPEHLQHPSGKDPDWIYPGQQGYDSQKAPIANKPYPKARGRLWTLIKELTDILLDVPIVSGNPSIGEKTADAIFAARWKNGADRFSGLHEIESALVPEILNKEQYRLLQSYISLSSWQDEKVLRPSFQWRINTPGPVANPVYEVFPDWYAGPCAYMQAAYPSHALDTRHLTYLPGDMVQGEVMSNWGGTLRPCHRPGADSNFELGSDLTGPVKYDFNHDGVIQAPDPNNPYAYHEWQRHDHDVYMYSDMQTRYFALEPRSPIDLNTASPELLEALINPIQGWYLKEAPAVWDGESPRARAEDWSQPSLGRGSYYIAEGGYPWLYDSRINIAHVLLWFGYSCSTSEGFLLPDESQYYFYDSYAKEFTNWFNFEPNSVQSVCALKNGRYGELAETESFRNYLSADPTTTVGRALAQAIYGRIHPDSNNNGIPDGFSPFSTWEEFETFILDLADRDGIRDLPGTMCDFDNYMAHALIANFNPNSRINDFNPNKNFYLHVDKSQLSGFTAELCFHPMGVFDIRSLGLVRGSNAVMAEDLVYSNVKTMSILRISNQEEFLGNALNEAERFNESNGPMFTHGAKTGYRGNSLQSYPEPQLAGEAQVRSSVFDGYLSLATLSPDRREYFGDDFSNTIFLADFAQTLSAGFAAGAPNPVSDQHPQVWRLDDWRYRVQWIPPDHMTGPVYFAFPKDPTAQEPANNPDSRPLTKHFGEIYHANQVEDMPGNLHPDGALSDVARGLGFAALGNFGDMASRGRKGSQDFWVKPNFDVAHSNRLRRLFSAGAPAGNDEAFVQQGIEQWGVKMIPFHYMLIGEAGEDQWDFSLYYFSRGGKRVTGSISNDPNSPLDDDVNFGYDADYNLHDGRWLPTRSFFLSAAILNASTTTLSEVNGTSTTTANQSWREPEQINGFNPRYNFETRQWSHVAISWDWVGDSGPNPPLRQLSLCVNGKTTPVNRDQMTAPSLNPLPAGQDWENQNLKHGLYLADAPPNYVYFGGASSEKWRNFVADSTFDEIVSSKIQQSQMVLEQEFSYGRYYSENDAEYVSPEFDLFQNLPKEVASLKLMQVDWTGYWPRNPEESKTADHQRFNSNLNAANSDEYTRVEALLNPANGYPDDPMSQVWGENWIPFTVDIMNPQNAKWRYAQELGLPKNYMPGFAGASRDAIWQDQPLVWKRKLNHKFRFKAHFNLNDSQILYCSPILDDLTFIFVQDFGIILFWTKE